jgi:hypothetical protein
MHYAEEWEFHESQPRIHTASHGLFFLVFLICAHPCESVALNLTLFC